MYGAVVDAEDGRIYTAKELAREIIDKSKSSPDAHGSRTGALAQRRALGAMEAVRAIREGSAGQPIFFGAHGRQFSVSRGLLQQFCLNVSPGSVAASFSNSIARSKYAQSVVAAADALQASRASNNHQPPAYGVNGPLQLPGNQIPVHFRFQ